MFDFGYAFSLIAIVCVGIFCIFGTFKLSAYIFDYLESVSIRKDQERERFKNLREYAASRLKDRAWDRYSQEWYPDFSESALDILVGDPIDFPRGSEGYQKKMDRLYDMLTK